MKKQIDLSKIKQGFVFRGLVDVVCIEDVEALCKKPYYNHPKGCPNYGKRKDCPPRINFFTDVYESKVMVVGVVFNFEEYLEKRRVVHPNWSERQLRNPRHWQNYLKSQLKKHIKNLFLPSMDEVIWNPEAMGVNLTATCKKVDIELEWPPDKKVYRLALIGRRKI